MLAVTAIWVLFTFSKEDRCKRKQLFSEFAFQITKDHWKSDNKNALVPRNVPLSNEYQADARTFQLFWFRRWMCNMRVDSVDSSCSRSDDTPCFQTTEQTNYISGFNGCRLASHESFLPQGFLQPVQRLSHLSALPREAVLHPRRARVDKLSCYYPLPSQRLKDLRKRLPSPDESLFLHFIVASFPVLIEVQYHLDGPFPEQKPCHPNQVNEDGEIFQ